ATPTAPAGAAASSTQAGAAPQATSQKKQLANSGAELGGAIGAAVVLLGAGGVLMTRRVRG
ncbi:hypothetical protein SC381_08865, partial [Actinotignum sanguinis]|nr:hypothetical protein [Actinotignum sanguinis]